MSREWKPGDVAMVRNQWNVWNVAIYSVRPGGCVWAYGVSDAVSPPTAEARSLLVIDPEDHEALDPIIDLIWGDRDPSNRPATWRIREALKARLIEPPKPDEPTDFASLVLDRDGKRWVKLTGRSWLCEDGTQVGGYALIDAAEVLS